MLFCNRTITEFKSRFRDKRDFAPSVRDPEYHLRDVKVQDFDTISSGKLRQKITDVFQMLF